MNRPDRGDHTPDHVEEASLLRDPADDPVVPVPDEDMLENGLPSMGDGRHLDHRTEALGPVVAGELAKRPFDLFDAGRNLPLDDQLGVGGDEQVVPEGLGDRESERFAHDGPDLGVVVHPEGRDVERAQIEGGVVADDDRHRRGPTPGLVLPLDLPVVSGGHVQTESPRPLVHRPEKRHVVEAALRVAHHRGHVDVGSGIHPMVADDGEVSEIGRVARLHDFLHRRLGPIDHHRCQHLGLTSGVFETQGERPVGRAEPESEGAALPERVEVRREVERRRL